MAQIPQQIRTLQFRIFVLIAVAIGIIVGVVVGKTRRGNSGPNVPQVVVLSTAPSVRVVSANRQTIGEMSVLNITLQNVSSKNIKAYVISSGKAWYTKNYLFVDTVFAPNSTDTSTLSGDRLSSNESDKDLTVTGVLFEDGTVDGEMTSTLRLIQNYRGVKEQAKRLTTCLEQLSHATGLQEQTAFAKCENDVANLPVTEGSADNQAGLRNAQLMFSTQLTEIKDMLRANRSEEAKQKKESFVRRFQALGQTFQ